MNYKIQITEYYVNCVRVHDITTLNNSVTINPTQLQASIRKRNNFNGITLARRFKDSNFWPPVRQVNSIIWIGSEVGEKVKRMQSKLEMELIAIPIDQKKEKRVGLVVLLHTNKSHTSNIPNINAFNGRKKELGTPRCFGGRRGRLGLKGV